MIVNKKKIKTLICVLGQTRLCNSNIIDPQTNQLINCGVGIELCDEFGNWGPCYYYNTQPEQCNDWDDDCDGQVDEGEECDDGNRSNGDGCDSLCFNEVCGNDRVQSGEQCDDGNNLDGDGCDNECFREECGNGRVQSGESCDDGALDADDLRRQLGQLERLSTTPSFIGSL